MRLRRPARRRLFVPVASFGDIAFLLIAFFVLSSVFMQEENIEVVEARAPNLDEMEEARVRIVMDRHGTLWLRGRECRKHDLKYAVEELIADRTDKRVMLKIDRTLPEQDFGEVLMALSDVGAEIVLLGAQEEN